MNTLENRALATVNVDQKYRNRISSGQVINNFANEKKKKPALFFYFTLSAALKADQ